MKNEVFIYYAKCLFQIYGIPVRIYKGAELLVREELVPLPESLEGIFDTHMLQYAARSNENYALFQSDNQLSYAYIRNNVGMLSLLIGPSRAADVNRNRLLSKNPLADNILVSEKLLQSLELYLNAIPIMQAGRFATIISEMNAVIHGQILEPEQMKIYKPMEMFDAAIHKGVAKHFEEVAYEDIEKANYYDYEKRLLLLIRNGMTEQLMHIWQEAYSRVNVGAGDGTALRMAKNNCILSIGIVSNAVLDEGLNQHDVYKLRSSYITQTEKCMTVQEVIDLRFNLLIDFCSQVENSRHPSSNVPIVNYAVQYINNNIEKKLSLQDIANHVHAGKTYLCAEFGKAMGVGITRYIQEQKVQRAKQLLLLTDKPLSVISELLSFSSQSYFQNIFKEITGITPKEFRNQTPLK